MAERHTFPRLVQLPMTVAGVLEVSDDTSDGEDVRLMGGCDLSSVICPP
ncbi:hypothetical protein ACIRO3_36750 [Streptomyces sp. NPDC102278]